MSEKEEDFLLKNLTHHGIHFMSCVLTILLPKNPWAKPIIIKTKNFLATKKSEKIKK